MVNKFFFIFIVCIATINCTSPTTKKNKPLPYLGHKQMDETGKEIPHQVAPFQFINQDSLPITQADLQNKITVVDFFFTTCPTICPVMTKNMKSVQEYWKNEPKIQFMSHTVDPKTDTPKKLKRFAKFYKADLSNWHFLTGSKEKLYQAGVNSYLLPSQEDALAPGGFLHSEYFVLVDKNLHLRGMYDGTKKTQMDSLNNHIEKLLNDK